MKEILSLLCVPRKGMKLKMEEIKKFLKEKGYEDNDINKILSHSALPKQNSEKLLTNIKEIYELFSSLGYTQQEIIKMTKVSSSIFGYNLNNIKQKIEGLTKLGYSKIDVINMTKSYPQMFGHTVENIEKKIKDIMTLEYSKEETQKMTKVFPQIFGYSKESLKQKIKDLEELGYKQKEIIKMTKTAPQLYSYNLENIKQKIEDMIKLGYTKEDILNITKALPSIFGLRIENIKQKIEYIKQLGYSREEVMNITKALPQIFGLSIENIKQKIEFYDSINLHKLIIENPKQLMQSTALSYARYMFYKDNGIIIDENNYNKLFIGQKVFEQKYGVKKEELLLRYNYKKYIENLRMKNTQELGKETTKEQINTEFLDSIEEAQEKQQKAIDHKKEEITN